MTTGMEYLENNPSYIQEVNPSNDWEGIAEKSRNIFSQTPSGVTPTGNTDTINPATTQAVSSAIGTAAQVGSKVIQGVAQSKQTEASREEARQIAAQQAQSDEKKQNVNNAIRSQQQEIEAREIALKKRKSDFDIKINTFLYNVKKDQENKQNFMSNVDGLFGSLATNEQTKNMIVGFAKG